MACNDEGSFVEGRTCNGFDKCDEGSCVKLPHMFETTDNAPDLRNDIWMQLCTSAFHSAPMPLTLLSPDGRSRAVYAGGDVLVVDVAGCCNDRPPPSSGAHRGQCPWAVTARFRVGQDKGMAWSPSGRRLAVLTNHGTDSKRYSEAHVYSVRGKRVLATIKVQGVYAHRVAFEDDDHLLVADVSPDTPRRITLPKSR